MSVNVLINHDSQFKNYSISLIRLFADKRYLSLILLPILAILKGINIKKDENNKKKAYRYAMWGIIFFALYSLLNVIVW